MKVSVIINHYHKQYLLKLCLRYLLENLDLKENEIIVVDSEAIPDTAEMIKENFNNITYIPFEENVGFSKMVNAGLEVAKGEYAFIINYDIILTSKEAIPKMAEFMDKNPDVGLIGPRLMNFNGTIQQTYFSFYTPATTVYRRIPFLAKTLGKKDIDRFLMKDVDKSKPFEAYWLMGSALFARMTDVKQIGLFDEKRFFMYFEDVDWCRRFRDAGKKVMYYPLVYLYHYHQKASRSKNFVDMLKNPHTYVHTKSALKYFLKYKFKS